MTPQTPSAAETPPARRTASARIPAPRTVPEMLALRAGQEPERTAIVVEGEGTLTFGEWERRSHAIAHGLLGCGVRPGDRVALLFGSRDWVDFAVAYCAVQLAGAVAVPLSDRLAPAELRYMLDHCEASAVLCGRDLKAPDGDRWTAAPAELEDAGSGPVGVRAARRIWPRSSTPPGPPARPRASAPPTPTWPSAARPARTAAGSGTRATCCTPSRSAPTPGRRCCSTRWTPARRC